MTISKDRLLELLSINRKNANDFYERYWQYIGAVGVLETLIEELDNAQALENIDNLSVPGEQDGEV